MSIVEDPASNDLNQGDILKGIALYSTHASWTENKTLAERVKAEACLVLSRPCVASNKDQIIVAPIESNKQATKLEKEASFKDVLEFLRVTRDGLITPDRFYLGQIPVLGSGRFYAKLDSLHTIYLPDRKLLSRILPTIRVARLCADFCRDLHTRLFAAFAHLGFEDHSWHSTEDLDWLISYGDRELAPIREQCARAAADGKSNRELEKLLADRESELAPYKQERDRRKKTGSTLAAMKTESKEEKAVIAPASSAGTPIAAVEAAVSFIAESGSNEQPPSQNSNSQVI